MAMWYQFFYISSLVVILHNLTKEKQSSTNITEKHDDCIEKPRHNRPPVYLETHAKDALKVQIAIECRMQLPAT